MFSGVTRGREQGEKGGPTRVTTSRGDTRPKMKFLWLNLEKKQWGKRGKIWEW